VPGDEEEDGVDDLENEFNWSDKHDSQYVAESMLHANMSYGRGADLDGVPQPFQPIPNVPLLTNGQMVPANETSHSHAACNCNASSSTDFCFAKC
jgi:cellulose synthase A